MNAKERLVVCGDMNGHVGTMKDGFVGVHGGYGYGDRNAEGEMLLEFADAMKLVVANTWLIIIIIIIIVLKSFFHASTRWIVPSVFFRTRSTHFKIKWTL